VKKIKVEVESHRLSNSRSSLHEEPHSRPSSPDKTQRIPHGAPNAPLVSKTKLLDPQWGFPISWRFSPQQTKEAQARMEEMRALIGKRQTADLLPVVRAQRTNIFGETTSRVLPAASGGSDEFSRKLEDLFSDVDKNLVQALSHQETLQNELKTLSTQLREVRPSPAFT